MYRLRSRYRGAGIRHRLVAPALAVFFALLFGGCADSCFLFVSNSGTGQIAVAAGSDGSCPITKPSGAAQFRIGGFENSTGPIAPQHILLMLDGVVGNEDAAAALASPGWQELAPGLAEHPVQVDLLAPIESSTVFPASVRASVNSGVYRQLGLRLLPSPASRDLASPGGEGATAEKNVCGKAGWHCVVFADGSVKSIALPLERIGEGHANPVLWISNQQIAGSSILVLPGTVRTYAIRFDLRSSLILSGNNAILVRPVFRVSPE